MLEEAAVAAGSRIRRIAIGLGGGVLLIIGIIAIPYPGPGWLIVFTALAILATEFEWARRLLAFARGKYDAWEAWLKRQTWWVRAIFWLLTAAVVVTTLWLLNAYGLINAWLHLGWDWLDSPIL